MNNKKEYIEKNDIESKNCFNCGILRSHMKFNEPRYSCRYCGCIENPKKKKACDRWEKNHSEKFIDLDQGDQVTILEIARVALNDKSILDQLDISDEYADELKSTLTKMTDEMTEMTEMTGA